jgi:hypothetical protein
MLLGGSADVIVPKIPPMVFYAEKIQLVCLFFVKLLNCMSSSVQINRILLAIHCYSACLIPSSIRSVKGLIISFSL